MVADWFLSETYPIKSEHEKT